MNIWLLHPFAGGPGLGRHWRPFWLADAWTRMGHRPLVVSAGFHHLHRKPRSFRAAAYRTMSISGFSKPRAMAPAVLAGCGTIFPLGPDFVMTAPEDLETVRKARSHHRFNAASVLYFCGRTGSRSDTMPNFWVEVRDLWPESIVALGMTPAWHPLVKGARLEGAIGLSRCGPCCLPSGWCGSSYEVARIACRQVHLGAQRGFAKMKYKARSRFRARAIR